MCRFYGQDGHHVNIIDHLTASGQRSNGHFVSSKSYFVAGIWKMPLEVEVYLL